MGEQPTRRKKIEPGKAKAKAVKLKSKFRAPLLRVEHKFIHGQWLDVPVYGAQQVVDASDSEPQS